MLVPSRATMSVRTQREAKASTSLVVGFQACASSFLFSDSEEESGLSTCDCLDRVGSAGGSKSTAMSKMTGFALKYEKVQTVLS